MASECVSEEEEAIVVFSMAAKSMLPYDDAPEKNFSRPCEIGLQFFVG